MSHYEQDRAAWFAQQRFAPMRVQFEVPDGRWQCAKARLRRVPGLGWLKVRMRRQSRFVGHVSMWPTADSETRMREKIAGLPDGSMTITFDNSDGQMRPA